MSRRKKKSSSSPRGSVADSNVLRVKPPTARLGELFKVIHEVARAADLAGMETEVQSDDDRFDIAVFARGINIVKATRSLCADAHWEMASSLVRQLFELVLNVEWITKQSDPTAARFLFSKYGLLQSARHQLETIAYAEETSRPVDAERRQFLRDLLDGVAFSEFKGKPRADGSIRWVDSWNRKSVRELAEASDQRLRVHQYSLLYRRWSEETHATPGALMEGMFRQVTPGWVDRVVADDDKETAEVLSMAVMLFLDLWRLLPGAPEDDWEAWAGWIGRLREWTIDKYFDEDPESPTFRSEAKTNAAETS
ncbi:DUF5677 domain-containing protein [uncultured Microbacterium sp.]|uniref:DUF5677 domain-containing protein n=1 Tax=uncultured Microbacterium sp. TaxID=191216 RepID=UPI0025E34B89|nr:DUF5677 domain-containing protein [uncultured Microbacterium sp.]